MSVRLTKIAVTVTAAVGLAIGFAGSASASADGPLLCNPTNASCTWFQSNGDVVWIKDMACDNRAAAAQVEIPSVGIYDDIFNHAGCGSSWGYSYGTNVPEGVTVYYRPCVGNATGTDVVDCNSGWTHGTS